MAIGTVIQRITRKRWVLPLAFVVVAIFVSMFGWLLVHSSSTLTDQFRLDAAKAALTVASGLVLGGALKFVLDSHADARESRQREADRRIVQLTELRTVHDRAESARLLIPAHRSAATYGDLMRDLIDAQVTLLDIRRAVATEPHGRFGPGVADAFSDMVGYLQALHEEYRHHFRDASDIERYDLELTDQDYRRVAAEQLRSSLMNEGTGSTTGAVPPPTGPSPDPILTGPVGRDEARNRDRAAPRSSGRAWALLQDPSLFPVLHDFCLRGPAYQRYFLDQYHAVVRALLNDPAAPRHRGNPAAEDIRFARHTHDMNEAITAACVVLAHGGTLPPAPSASAKPSAAPAASPPPAPSPSTQP